MTTTPEAVTYESAKELFHPPGLSDLSPEESTPTIQSLVEPFNVSIEEPILTDGGSFSEPPASEVIRDYVTIEEFMEAQTFDECEAIDDRLVNEASDYLDSLLISSQFKFRTVFSRWELIRPYESPAPLLVVDAWSGHAALPISMFRVGSEVFSFDMVDLYAMGKDQSLFEVTLKSRVESVAEILNRKFEYALSQEDGVEPDEDGDRYMSKDHMASFFEQNELVVASAGDLEVFVDINRYNIETSVSIVSGFGWINKKAV